MAFFILCTSIFIIFFQPEYVFESLAGIPFLKLSVVAGILLYFVTTEKNKEGFFSDRVNIFFFVFAIFQAISSLRLGSFEAIATLNVWLRIGVTYFLVFKLSTSYKKIKTQLLMILFGIGYLGVYFFTNYVRGYEEGTLAWAYGWFVNANDLVLIFSTCIPLCALFLFSSTSFFVRIASFSLIILFAVNILFTSSRGGLLGLGTVGALILLSSSVKIPKLMKIIAMGGLFFAIVSVGLVNVLARQDLADSGLLGDDSSEHRLVQWEAGIRMALDRPLTGVGRGRFIFDASDYGGIGGLQPHNTIVQVIAETGLPGGICWVLFCFIPLFRAHKSISEFKKAGGGDFPDSLKYMEYICISLVGFWVCAFFGNRYNEYILYILVSLLCVVNNFHKIKNF